MSHASSGEELRLAFYQPLLLVQIRFVAEFGPLANGELRVIDYHLDQGNLEQAQALLAQSGQNQSLELGSSYLATKLLYLKGRLDAESVRDRLLELLGRVSPFPEAQQLLQRVSAQLMQPARPPSLGSAPPRSPLPRSAPPRSPPPRSVPPRSPLPHSGQPYDGYNPGEAPTREAIPSVDIPVSEPSRRPLVALGFDAADQPLPGPPRLPHTSQPPAQGSSSPPVSKAIPAPSFRPSGSPIARAAPVPRISETPDPGSQSSWRARAYGMEPTALPSVPPGAPRRPSPVPRDAGRYRYISGNPEADSTSATGPHSAEVAAPSRRKAGGPSMEDPGAFPPNRESARQEFDHEAWQAVAELNDPQDPAELASAGAKVLGHNGATHWFAPFDQSLYSLQRLELALAALTGRQESKLGQASYRILGAYLGETIRHCHKGQWQGALDPVRAEVVAGAISWKPFCIISECITSGGDPPLMERVAPGLAAEGTAPWLAHRPTRPTRAPWRNAPLAEDFPNVVAALDSSALSWVSRVPLNGTWESLEALEELVAGIARCAAPVRGNEPWVVRLCVLLGAYVGEVVRRRVGGQWRTSSAGPSEEGYLLVLPNGFEAEPIAAIRERLKAQNGVRLSAYASALLRK